MMNTNTNEIDFLASVTHDLKSPLNAILATIEMHKANIASDSYSKEELLSDLSIAEMAGLEMLELIQNMLTTARMQAGKESVEPSWLSSSDIVGRAKGLEKTFQSEARCKKVNFSVFVGKIPKLVYWDIKKIRLFAINNLISNSLKFLGHTGGTVKVLIEGDDDNKNVIVSVMDDGPGIPQSERANIFEKYNQASNTHHHFQGSGFGLFNAYQIISQHHGRIEIFDGLNGKGVTFRVTIPAIPFVVDEAVLKCLEEA